MELCIAPAIISADFADLATAVKATEQGGADVIHIDVMDGYFASPLTMGSPIISAIRHITNLPLDVHLMVREPDRHISDIVRAGADIVTVHAETCLNLHRTLQVVREHGVRVGVAVNPSTAAIILEEVLTEVDLVVVMTVDPGYREFIERMLLKLKRIREMLDRAGCFETPLAVDGGINMHTARNSVIAGANWLIAASAIYKSTSTIEESIQSLRNAAHY